jgi:hypothetical protein
VIKQEVGDNCIMKSLITFILFPKGDKMVRACSMYGEKWNGISKNANT